VVDVGMQGLVVGIAAALVGQGCVVVVRTQGAGGPDEAIAARQQPTKQTKRIAMSICNEREARACTATKSSSKKKT